MSKTVEYLKYQEDIGTNIRRTLLFCKKIIFQHQTTLLFMGTYKCSLMLRKRSRGFDPEVSTSVLMDEQPLGIRKDYTEKADI